MVELLKWLDDIRKVAIEKLRMMDAPTFFLVLICIGLAGFYIFTGRTDKQINDAIVLGREKTCQEQLNQCRTEKDFDNKQLRMLIDSANANTLNEVKNCQIELLALTKEVNQIINQLKRSK